MRNLKIEEMFAGAWVQQFSIGDGAVSLPLRVFGVNGDGSLMLETDGTEPFQCFLGKVYPMPIDERSLSGFGFVRTKGDNVWLRVVGDVRLTVALRMRGGVEECRRCAISGKIACWNEEIRYVHELQRWWNDRVLFPYNISLELRWRKAVKREELV